MPTRNTPARRARIRASEGLNITTDRPDVIQETYGQQAPVLQQPVNPVRQLPGTSPVPNTPNAPMPAQGNAGDPAQGMNYFLDGLQPEDIEEIRNIYANLNQQDYNNPEVLNNAINQAEQAQPQQPQKWSRIKNFARKAGPWLGALGAGIAGFFAGGPATSAAAATAAKSAAAALALGKTVESAIPRPGQPGNAMTGKEGQMLRESIYDPAQRATMNKLLEEGMIDYGDRGNFSPLQNLLSGQIAKNLDDRFDFGPIRDRAVKRFNEETLPGIFNRFTLMGKGAQSTGAFKGMLARGGADLNEGLAELEQNYNLQRRPLDLQQQNLLQNLLGQQQNYNLNKRNIGLDAMRSGLTSPYHLAYKDGSQGALQSAFPYLAQGAASIGKEYIKNKFRGNTGINQPVQ